MELEGLVTCGPDAVRYVANYVKDTVKSKAYWVDTLATMSVFQPLQLFNEMSFAGMSFEDSLDVRKASIPVALLLVRPVFKLRDKWAKDIWKVDKNSSGIKKTLSDISFLSVVPPIIYSSVLTIGGAEFEEVTKAVPAMYISTLAVGVPYSKVLDRVRNYFGTSPFLEDAD